MSILTIFITGLFAGGLTCLAVQGGLLASSIAQQKSTKLPITSFLISRLVAYTILGLMLGALGSIVQLSIQARVILQVAVAIFMIGTALNLIDAHPIFRYFVIQPPKFLTRMVKNQSRSKEIFAPALLGAMTVLIPCGATQAMMAYAVSTGSATQGAITMFVFILGTSPLFYVLGYAAKRAGSSVGATFNKIAAAAIILIALYNLLGALSLAGINLTQGPSNTGTQQNAQVVQSASIYFTDFGYKTMPEVINVKAGSQVTLHLVNESGAGCIQAFTIPAYNIQTIVPVGKSEKVTFIAPSSPQQLSFMCSMGMYKGYINVL
ncbi:MAG: Thiol:disulfide interchange protein DsbD [Microgenomates bacterium OLB23]|nr:MAG: Thiol:disulfide interchange protein DsbD [Microgenomates bacterium OLB23]